MYSLGKRSLDKLKGVHPDLQSVVHEAIKITPVDFTVLEGMRSRDRQIALVKAGKSQTMNSRHLTGHAVDLGAWVDGTIDWSWEHYENIAWAMKKASHDLGVKIVWGGDWVSFKDGVHFELDREFYT
tara:strand:+ start:601 stop:981 length:381 start_codon:yes stop_codon:yes gene_type:complete